MAELRFLVPISESPTLRETVASVAGRLQQAQSTADRPLVRFVLVDAGPATAIDTPPGGQEESLFKRVTGWLREDLAERADTVTIETAWIGTDRYISGPEDVATLLEAEVAANDIERIVLDPGYDPQLGAPLLRPLTEELRAHELPVTEAEGGRRRVAVGMLGQTTPRRLGALFTLSFLFYQALAGGISVFDLVTGTVAGLIVAVGLGRVSLQADPTGQTPRRLLRGLLYAPYLLKEILISNVRVAAVILHPRLPIEPRMVEYRPSIWGPLQTTVLANSLTLTPGTLTVRANNGRLLVHTLTPWARDGIESGGLETAVRFLFGGRSALPVTEPGARGDVTTTDSTEGDPSE